MSSTGTNAPYDYNEGQTLLPGEDYNQGLYLHTRTTPVTTLTGPDGTTTVYVGADAFMDMQRQRDDLRRTLGLIAAWRVNPNRLMSDLGRLLAAAGFDEGQGRAILSLMASVSADRDNRLPEDEVHPDGKI